MSFERPDIFANERIIVGGNVTVILKDPGGLGEVLDSKNMMALATYEEPEGSRALGGEVIFYPAESERPRGVIATVDYLPNRKRRAKEDLSYLHASLLHSRVVAPSDVTTSGADTWGSPWLAVSVGKNGDGMKIYVGSNDDGRATGQIRMELPLPFNPEPTRDHELVGQLLLSWGIARSAMNGPRHRKGDKPTTIVIEGMTYDDHIYDLWRVIVDYGTFSKQADEIMPELAISQSDLEYLSTAYPFDSETLAYAIDHLISRHLLASDVGSIPEPITIHSLAKYFAANGR